MTDTGDEVSGASDPDRVRPVRRQRWLLVAVITVLLVAVLVWLGFVLIGSDSESSGDSRRPADAGEDVTVQPGRRYSDAELGIWEVFEEQFTPEYARFRSPQDADEYNRELWRYMWDEAVGHKRERMWFESNLAAVYWGAFDELPTELGSGGLLDQAFEEAMDRCAAESGWPGVTLYGVSQSEVDAFGEQFGLTLDGFLDLRHECAREAASYPTLDPALRDELLGRIREHYRAAVHEYLREFPDAEVPLVDHPGGPRPLAEQLIKDCQRSPDPPACADEYRVELPAE